jgi:hypothetical protein
LATRQFTGLARSAVYRWFTDPASRLIYPEKDHPAHGRIYTAQLRVVVTQQGPQSPAEALADTLRGQSTEFAALWSDHEIGIEYTAQKRLRNPEVGLMDLHCQTLLDPGQMQSLLVFTATPGTESYEKLQLLSVIGTQRLTVPSTTAQ